MLRERPSHATDLARCCETRSDGVGVVAPYTIIQYCLLNSSNKRACSNIFVNVTLVSRTHINGQKLKENVKRHTRKLLKHMKKTNLKMKKNTQNKKTLMLKTLKDN